MQGSVTHVARRLPIASLPEFLRHILQSTFLSITYTPNTKADWKILKLKIGSQGWEVSTAYKTVGSLAANFCT
jgi:hypothetical protein